VLLQLNENGDSKQLILPNIKNVQNTNIDIVRFNPETIYRKEYWVYQKELINSISLEGEPIVLLIPRRDEIKPLENYFASLGYFLPDKKMALSRQLEKLHEASYPRKILIAHIDEIKYIPKII
jgi:hypothetical protein